MFKSFVFKAAEQGQGLTSFCGDGHGSDRFHIADHDLTTFREGGDIGVGGDRQQGVFVLRQVYAACCSVGPSFPATFHGSNSSMCLIGCSPIRESTYCR